jgi:cation diffusion facilitator family transporter
MSGQGAAYPSRDGDVGNLKIRAARLSVLSNSCLVLLKLAVGISIGSVAVISEAIHSATDLLASLIAYFAVRASDQPPDIEHPYGHGKLESISGLLEALLIAVAGLLIVAEAVGSWWRPAHRPLTWGIAVMGCSTIVNFFVSRYLFFVARKTESIAIEADAHHLSLDIVTSLGVALGLALVAVTRIRLFDPLVAIIVGLFVLKTALDIFREATAPLIDRRLPDGEVRAVEATMRADNRILGWHKLRTRKSGSQRHVDVHIQVDDEMSLKEAHRVTEELEDRMRDALPNVWVMIHTEPYEEELRHHEETPH